MTKNFLFLIALIAGFCTRAQVGINTTTPSSTLTVSGSFEAEFKEISSATYTLTNLDHYVTYNGTAASTFTLPTVATGNASFSGRIYKIKNISGNNVTLQASGTNTLRLDNNGAVSSFAIPPGGYVEVVNNSNGTGGTWDLFYTAPTKNNVEIYGVQFKIPPHASGSPSLADWTNHSNTSYDTPATSNDSAWWLISKTSTTYSHTANYHTASMMTLVYEYQGTPFNLTNMYPVISSGNGSSFPDIFTASVSSLQNNGTGGKTRLTISVARIDFVGNNLGTTSNWTGTTFFINALLARKLY